MDLKKDYYGALGVPRGAGAKEVKKAYYALSKKSHPDMGGDAAQFSAITEAYDVLCGEARAEYDAKSRHGANYNEYYELFSVELETTYEDIAKKREHFKSNEVLDVYVEVGPGFQGSLEYERWVKCKACDGTGRDFSSKIVIRDVEGNILKTFDADDGCDFCEGSGTYMGLQCSFCHGKGKVGISECGKCGGAKRVLGKQKLSGIKLAAGEASLEAMGHHSKNEAGKVGWLIVRSKS